MSAIVDVIRPGSLLLSNESFASTNEQEGSQIALHIFRTMADCGVTVVAVTHLVDLAAALYRLGGPALFLRAEREPDGRRTFRLAEGNRYPPASAETSTSESFEQPIGRPTFSAPPVLFTTAPRTAPRSVPLQEIICYDCRSGGGTRRNRDPWVANGPCLGERWEP